MTVQLIEIGNLTVERAEKVLSNYSTVLEGKKA